jgi:chorismate synthase
MSSNSFGRIFRLTTFGESHGAAIGGIVDGVPANIPIDLELIQQELDRRKPGQSNIVTQRKESDTVQILSGIFDGKTTGAPIGFLIPNENQKAKDYDHIKDVYRPSHADFVYDKKYGHRDHRGGGRSSARETACRVVGGAIAKQILSTKNIEINAYVDQVGDIKIPVNATFELEKIELNKVRCPHSETALKMEQRIKEVRSQGNTIGGAISCVVKYMPVGVGAPIYAKLSSELGAAMLSINAVKGFEIGSGFSAISMLGSQHNDIFISETETQSNFSGGVQGGISNGQPIQFRVAFKPVATVMQSQDSINSKGEKVVVDGKGRHDPCVVPRAVPIVEAMCAMVILDQILLAKTVRL